MKRIAKVLTAGLSALTLLSASALAPAAATVKDFGQVKVICAGGSDCGSVQELLNQYGCSQELINQYGCGQELLRIIPGYCPDGNCSTEQPAPSAPSQPVEKPTQPVENPTQPVVTPAQPVETPTQPVVTAPEAPSENAEFNAAYENEVLRLVNVERAKYGLSALSRDEGAVKAAHIRAKEIVQSFSHTRPDGRSCFTAAAEVGLSYRTAGENIAYGYASPQQVVNGWMNSEGHRKNILSSSYTKLGVGCYESGGVLYWSQFFIG